VVTLAAAPVAGSSRIDLVVLQVRDNALDAGGNNDFVFQAITGTVATPGPGPVPAVPNNAYPMGQLTIPGGAANLNGVAVTNRRVPLYPRDSLYARIRRNAAYTTVAGVVTNIPFDTIEEDPWAGVVNLGAAGVAYVCPIAGHYLLNARTSAPGSTRTIIEAHQNGTLHSRGIDVTASAIIGASVTCTINAAANDQIQAFYLTQSAVALEAGIGLTWMEIRYVGP
jgi:hypothetical protein